MPLDFCRERHHQRRERLAWIPDCRPGVLAGFGSCRFRCQAAYLEVDMHTFSFQYRSKHVFSRWRCHYKRSGRYRRVGAVPARSGARCRSLYGYELRRRIFHWMAIFTARYASDSTIFDQWLCGRLANAMGLARSLRYAVVTFDQQRLGQTVRGVQRIYRYWLAVCSCRALDQREARGCRHIAPMFS